MPREPRLLIGREDAPQRHRVHRDDSPWADEPALADLLSALRVSVVSDPAKRSQLGRVSSLKREVFRRRGIVAQNEANSPGTDSTVTYVHEKGYVNTSCGGRAGKQSQLASFGVSRVKRGRGLNVECSDFTLPPGFLWRNRRAVVRWACFGVVPARFVAFWDWNDTCQEIWIDATF